MCAGKVVEEEIHWPLEWDDEVERATRYPREAAHWCASRRTRKARIPAFCAELDAVIARRIRAARVEAGLRQIDLADAIGVTQTTISRVESGQSAASFADIVRIAIQLRRPFEAFIKPPKRGVLTGWERHPTLPRIPRELSEAAERGELPIEHEIYD